MAVATMICVYRLLEVRLGHDLWVTRLWMNGGHGTQITKLLGMHINTLSRITLTLFLCLANSCTCVCKVVQLASIQINTYYMNLI